MTRTTAVLLAVAAVASGAACGSTCPPTDAIVYWSFTDATGAQTPDCASAGVASLRVLVNGQAQLDANTGAADLLCQDYPTGGVMFPTWGLAGPVQLEVDAYDASGNLLYSDQESVSLQACGETVVDASLTAVPTLTLSLAGFQACPISPVAYVWYSLTDVTNPHQPTPFALVNGLHGPTQVPCAGDIPLGNVPDGDYRLDWVQVVTQSGADPLNPYQPLYTSCSPVTFTHQGSDAVTATLAPASTFCPGS